jgi:hypothetical protein
MENEVLGMQSKIEKEKEDALKAIHEEKETLQKLKQDLDLFH